MLHRIQSIRATKFRICDSIKLENGITIPCITGQTGQVDVISQNGYRYKTEFWDKVLSNPIVQSQVSERELLGCIEHPSDDEEYMRTSYDKASHVVIRAWVENHNPFAVLGLMNNEQGNIIKSLVEVGHKPGVSTRGFGAMEKDNISEYVSDEEYMFLGWDIVKSPNFADLKMEATPISDSIRNNKLFKELCDMNHLKDSADTHYARERLLKDMGTLIQELQSKFELLSQ